MSIYQQFKVERKSFVPRFFKILQAGGSRKPEELLKDSGINISTEEFWQQGFELVGNKIRVQQLVTDLIDIMSLVYMCRKQDL